MNKKPLGDLFVRKSNLAAEIMGKLINVIRKRELEIGDRLPAMDEIAKRLNVGQGSVREALKRMEMLGVVKIEHGRGIFVRKADIGSVVQQLSIFLTLQKADIIHLMDVRKVLEVQAARLGARNASEKEIAELAQILKSSGFRSNDPDEYVRDDLEFHMRLAEISKNPLYPPFLESIRCLFLEEMKAMVKLPGIVRKSNSFHKRIYEAVRNHSPEGAAQAMNSHLEDIENRISRDKKWFE